MSDIMLLGATGLVGGLVATGSQQPLIMLSRRAIAARGTHVVREAVPEQWPAIISDLRPPILINCLGTTIRAAGSKAAFRAIDLDLVLAAAQAAKAAGASHMITISSVGASASSSNFYLNTKGEVEAALRALSFDRLDILRPGLLTGDRSGPTRPGERIAMLAAPLTDLLFHGPLRRYRSIRADVVARAILTLAAGDGVGPHVYEHDTIAMLARRG